MSERADAVGQAYADTGPEDGGILAIPTPDGREVHIEDLTVDGSAVRIRLAGTPDGGDSNFCIINPPTLIPDPNGDVIVGTERFREDPLGALAIILAATGGAAERRRR